jgi:hypothetical protein
MLLSWRALSLCVLTGVALGVGLIATHSAPGLAALPPADTAAYRNSTRHNDLKYLYEALANYQRDHGSLPVQIPSTPTEICTSYGPNCISSKYMDLSFLITGGNYIETVPSDPLGTHIKWASGYVISRNADGAVQLSAERTENSATITVPE